MAKFFSFFKKKFRRRLSTYSPLPAECNPAETEPPPAQDALISHGVQSDAQIQELTKSLEGRSRTIRKMAQNLPKPPGGLAGNLSEYLQTLQETVNQDLKRLGPIMQGSRCLMGTMVECYHSQIFYRLWDLLQKTNNTKSLLLLLTWVLQSYLSLEMFDQLYRQEKKIDLLLLTEWVTNAKSKLFENVKKDLQVYLKNTLEIHRERTDLNDEEVCVGFYMDIIQATEAHPRAAETVSPTLAAAIRQVCFQELLSFLQRYSVEHTQTLQRITKMEQREMIYLLRTLNDCKEIKQYVRTNLSKTNNPTGHLLQTIIEVLENMEAFTLTCVKEIVSNTAESFLKPYFTGKKTQFISLIKEVQTCFPKKKWCQDVMETVGVEVYRIIAHTYVKQLVKVPQKKLIKTWSPDISQTVTKDAEILHNTMSDMVPGVKPQNQILLKSAELLEWDYDDMVLLKATHMLEECPTLREDLDFQMALLRWMGLQAKNFRELQDAIPKQRKFRLVSWKCCLPYCIRPTCE